jgi:hypothetical protein
MVANGRGEEGESQKAWGRRKSPTGRATRTVNKTENVERGPENSEPHGKLHKPFPHSEFSVPPACRQAGIPHSALVRCVVDTLCYWAITTETAFAHPLREAFEIADHS